MLSNFILPLLDPSRRFASRNCHADIKAGTRDRGRERCNSGSEGTTCHCRASQARCSSSKSEHACRSCAENSGARDRSKSLNRSTSCLDRLFACLDDEQIPFATIQVARKLAQRINHLTKSLWMLAQWSSIEHEEFRQKITDHPCSLCLSVSLCVSIRHASLQLCQ